MPGRGPVAMPGRGPVAMLGGGLEVMPGRGPVAMPGRGPVVMPGRGPAGCGCRQLAVPVLCASWTLAAGVSAPVAAGVSAPGLLLAAAMPLLVWMQDLVGNWDMAARAPLPSASSGDAAQHFPSRTAVLRGASM